MFAWISYEETGEIEMPLKKVNVTFKGKDFTSGEGWSEKVEAFLIAPHILLQLYENSSEFVFRVLDEKLVRNQDEIVIDDETYNQYIKTVVGAIDGIDIDTIEQNQEFFVSEVFVKFIETLANKN
ncbi:hypothetical protein ACFVRR_00870 [Gottfriedia sp. NPDC057948]|uniref:hypothetical protein n=1 Tax=Gottfriedia sp. NPDC057948 TaxID=3346287 RepID=UPI0036DED1D6